MMGMMDDKASKGCPAYTSVDKEKCEYKQIQRTWHNKDTKIFKKLLQVHKKPIWVKIGMCWHAESGNLNVERVKTWNMTAEIFSVSMWQEKSY